MAETIPNHVLRAKAEEIALQIWSVPEEMEILAVARGILIGIEMGLNIATEILKK